MPSITVPDYEGGSLPNLMSELENRLTGSAPAPRLNPDLAASIPEASTYVLFLFDGLGTLQLDHPAASPLKGALRGSIDAPFPATTTVSLATVATGLPPSQHGLLGYQSWLPDVDDRVVPVRGPEDHEDRGDRRQPQGNVNRAGLDAAPLASAKKLGNYLWGVRSDHRREGLSHAGLVDTSSSLLSNPLGRSLAKVGGMAIADLLQ